KVLYLLGGEVTAGDETYIDDVIETAGGDNVAAANITGYAQISREVVANQSPDYIIVSDEAPEVIPKEPAYNQTPAVQNDQIVTVDANYLNQPAPRTQQVLEDFASTWHPSAYEAAVESLETDTTAVTTATETPGFGPLVALVAILIGATRYRDP
ncbi:MAG: ABC transporter substrate-binding protein, partial [Halodesulfurarchaeum sp.]